MKEAEGRPNSAPVPRPSKGVTAVRVGAEGGVVGLGGKRQGSTAAPASHDLRGDDFLVLGSGGVVLQAAAEGGDVLVELAEDRVTAVAPERGRLRGLDAAEFVRVAQDAGVLGKTGPYFPCSRWSVSLGMATACGLISMSAPPRSAGRNLPPAWHRRAGRARWAGEEGAGGSAAGR
ncbi:hypothetical protein GCM10010359_40730 [Streptomyces morookaense]|nr:hypothetical protein GCM10010359_40730 [Streptomyces morookaense]